MAIIDVTPNGFEVRAIVDGLSFDALQQKTGAPLTPAPTLKTIFRNHQGNPTYG